MGTEHVETQRLTPAPRSYAEPDMPQPPQPRTRPELEHVIDRIGARYITDVQLLSDAVRRRYAAQVTEQDQQIRLLSHRVVTLERARTERRAVVDAGMIHVALAIAAISFLVAERLSGAATHVNTVIYIGSGFVATGLCVVYAIDAAHAYRHSPQYPRWLIGPTQTAYLVLPGGVGGLFGVVGYALLGVPLWVLALIGSLAIMGTVFLSLLRPRQMLILLMLILGVLLGAGLTLSVFGAFRPPG